MLSKEGIFGQTADLGLERVEVPEWGGFVFVRGLRASERDAYDASMWDVEGKERKQNTANMRARLLVRCVCDESGKRVFEDGDAAELGLRSGRVIDRLFDVACRLSGLGRAAVEAAEKN